MSASPFYKLEIFCPAENVEALLEVLSKAHAGEIGRYEACASITTITGTYRPMDGAKHAIGEVGTLFKGSECKIEVNCREEYLAAAIRAVREAHPYEEPLINVIPLANARFGGTI